MTEIQEITTALLTQVIPQVQLMLLQLPLAQVMLAKLTMAL